MVYERGFVHGTRVSVVWSYLVHQVVSSAHTDAYAIAIAVSILR